MEACTETGNESEKQPLEIENTAGNLKIPLANGNVVNIPLSAINISEEVNKSGIWMQVNETNTSDVNEKKKSPKATSYTHYFATILAASRRKKPSKKDEKRDEKLKLEKRLSVCREEEDEGIMIKYPDRRISQSTVCRIENIFREFGNITDIPKSDRTRILDNEQKLDILLDIQDNPHKPTTQVAADNDRHFQMIWGLSEAIAQLSTSSMLYNRETACDGKYTNAFSC
ncbi:hypothetical protein NQ318_016617 [Aromia moschata]|uniref:Uncharacterized protein n=1 Tax=Aromia moschata TaxID=1265417 RepID=A0AAV8XMM8_9CUCU|nr:hypothetical protein NQ318_016617 [Aromia moschata]